jgi:hypothetical protein
MLRGIASMRQHGEAYDRVVLANPAQLSQLDRNSLAASARRRGAIVDAVYDRGFFASRLRRDGQWRSRLLGLSADPITLSRVPADLAESPWARLTLVGREHALQEITAAGGDLVVTGRPGVGKTRLLASVDGVYFVDQYAAFGRLADDLRWLQPSILVIDDAGRSEQLIRQLVRFRYVESDIGPYRIVAVCWPDEAEGVTAWLEGAQRIELDLLERGELDRILLDMGVTGRLARSEILDQAEGRAGWAVTLGDILLRGRDPTSLLNGRALLGQVQRYLRRASIPRGATDVLAAVAATGNVTETELGELAAELGMPRWEMIGLLSDAAKSGLIDVEPHYDQPQRRNVRSYTVRPPMLADALVAERAFAAEVPGIDLRRLAQLWPAKSAAVAESAIDSALLGAHGARAEAGYFYEEVGRSSDTPQVTSVRLAQRYARIDREAARTVQGDARAAFGAWKAAGATSPWQIEPVIELSYLIARWYLVEDAVELLLDAALVDQRPLNPNPGHPLRKLTDLIHEFHPELPPPRDQRRLVARVADQWIAQDRSEERWTVYGAAVEDCLSVNLNAAVPNPGDPRSFQLTYTVETPDEIRRIYEEIWPPIRQRLEDAPPLVIKAVLEAVEGWLRLRLDRPFGRSHSQLSIDVARELGEQMLHELAPLTVDHPGLAMQLQEAGDRFGVTLDIPGGMSLAPFLADIDRRDDLQAAVQELAASISEAVEGWVTDDPLTVVQRLANLRAEVELANVRWPDRVEMACRALAERVAEPLSWADLALEQGLFPAASPFLTSALDQGIELGKERLGRYLSSPSARWATISAVLLAATSQNDRQQVIADLLPSDYRVLETLYFRQQLPLDISRDLLTNPSPAARGMVAAAMFAPGRSRIASWLPGELEDEWLDAIELLDPEATLGYQDHAAAQLTQFLATRYPDRLARWVRSRLEAQRAREGSSYDALPHSAWERLHHLPIQQKDGLWTFFSEEPAIRRLLGMHFVSEDTSWLEHALNTSLISADNALRTYNSLGPHPSVEQLARLLVPRGIEPQEIAAIAQGGMWTGEESAHYAQLVEQFQALAASSDQAVAAVGSVGVAMFTPARDEALARERRNRIRGEF